MTHTGPVTDTLWVLPDAPATAALDDIDARPGSTTSLLRTIIGLYLRDLGGNISAATLVALAADLGVDAPRARTGIARLKQKGLLLTHPDARGTYRLNPQAAPMLERGDRRIFHPRTMAPHEPWCLVSFSVPETQRNVRHQLRRRLQFIGAGTVGPGLWICPGHLTNEVDVILRDLGVRTAATLFRTEEPLTGVPLADAVTQWWDLDALRAEHERFLAAARHLDTPTPTAASAFAHYVHLIDAWRPLPYTDPGLPTHLLPSDWPAADSIALFTELSTRWAPPAREHVDAVVDTH